MKKILHLVGLLLLVFGCADEMSIPSEISQIESIVPENWKVSIQTENFVYGTIVEPLNSPQAVVLFVNQEEKFSSSECGDNYPTLILNFFDLDRKDSLVRNIEAEIDPIQCQQIIYDSTSNYIIYTSKCFINHGCISDDANALITPLHESLHEYFEGL